MRLPPNAPQARWTAAEDALLIEAARRGVKPKAISHELPGRTLDAATTRTGYLRKIGKIPPYAWGAGRPRGPAAKPKPKPTPTPASARQPGMRTCLHCGKPFLSASAANRICPRCSGLASRDGGPFDRPATLHYR